MELGEKLRQARKDAALSQRALCGTQITRNMLSQIENGSARPSMKTLQYLAARLEKPVSYFLEDELSASPNQLKILAARRCFDTGDWAGALSALEGCQEPDPVFDRERSLLWVLSCLELAETALRSHREPYARELLEQSCIPCPYCSAAIQRKRLLLMGRLGHGDISSQLPSLDEELLLRAREAAESGDLSRAGKLLDAAQERSSLWYLLRGRVYLAQKAYREAADHLLLAEAAFPKETVPQLETVFRELGDYEKAYLYACKGRAYGSNSVSAP